MRRIPFFAPIVTMTLAAGLAMAQTTSGDLVGTVKDSTGASIPGAKVTVTNQATGVVNNTTANGEGEYRVSNLLPGIYDISTNVSGFQANSLKGVRISLNSTATANVTLSVGASTTVEVSSDAGVVLDTTTTNLTTSFSNQELTELPTTSVGLGVINASLLSPGVASTGGIGIGVGPSIGGQRPRNNNFEIEGIDNNNKAVTGPLVYVPNDAVGGLSLITTQFSPEFGHSSGGQFNTNILSGTNTLHGRLYEYFQNRNLNSASGTAGGKIPNPKYDNNRYGGQIGGPILRDRLFFFANYERNFISENASGYVCVPSATGIAALNANAAAFSATNLAQYLKYYPGVTNQGAGGTGIDASLDNACGNEPTGAQYLTVNGINGPVQVGLGNYQINSSAPTLQDALTTSVDYTINSTDSLRLRYVYNTLSSTDTAGGASLPIFYQPNPNKFHLFALSEYHSFSPNLTNEFRLGYNRYSNTLGSGNYAFPGLDQFPTFQFYDQGDITVGPDGNAPQFTIQNLYQVTDNVSYVKGKHTIKLGFDGRKYISPQGFTQRARGDYEYANLSQYLQDLAPDQDGFAERSSGNHTYYGDQTALYGYINDTYRATPSLTFNVGLRYEFTSVPVGERSQALNSVSNVAGLISFHAPQPSYTSFAPRFGINYAPDSKTSIRAGFGIAYDVLFDNLGTLSFPPQYSVTEDVGSAGYPAYSSANFLKNGGLPPGTGSGTAVLSPTVARASTSAYLPNQVVPYAENYTLTMQRTFGSNYTAEIGYIGTRGIHLPTQDQLNIQPRVNTSNQLFTLANGSNNPLVGAGGQATTLANIENNFSNIVPTFLAARFTSKITSYQPYSSSNYNGLIANLTRRYQNGLQLNFSYTYSKDMDDATAEVFATVLTPRRPQNSQNVANDYSRSALDRTHRITMELVYDLPYGKHSNNFIKKNLIGNWTIAPIYTYESPEYATTLSGVNSNLNGDSGAAIDRTIINPNGVKGTATGSVPVVNPANQLLCATDSSAVQYGAANGNFRGLYTSCAADTIGYSAGAISATPGADPSTAVFTPSNAYYVQAGLGTLPNAPRNSLAIRPIDDIDLSAYKSLTVFDHYSIQFGAQAFNLLNHPQYIPGTIDNVNATSYTSSYNFQTASSSFFNRPDKVFLNNARAMQLTAKFVF
jgi:hypothetical protein